MTVEFMTEAMKNHAREMAAYRAMGSYAFYQAHPDLAPFDNGEGFWALEQNTSVGRNELVQYGKMALGNVAASEEAYLNRAASDLAGILKTKPLSLAAHYFTRVLDDDAQEALREKMWKELFAPLLPRSARADLSTIGIASRNGGKSALDIDPVGKILLSLSMTKGESCSEGELRYDLLSHAFARAFHAGVVNNGSCIGNGPAKRQMEFATPVLIRDTIKTAVEIFSLQSDAEGDGDRAVAASILGTLICASCPQRDPETLEAALLTEKRNLLFPPPPAPEVPYMRVSFRR